MDKKIRKQIRLIAEAIDDEPKMFGIRVLPGKHAIDQLVNYCQQNMIKWDWNNNKFIKAMRDAYHNAGMTVPTDKEMLVKDLQKESVQNPQLLNQLVSALGGMSRRTFMGLSAGGGVGLATGMIDFKGHEKSKSSDWDGTLKPGEHYRVTYRNWKNQTLLFKDLVFSSSNGHMYWFMDPRKPRQARSYKGNMYRRRPIVRTTKAQMIEQYQNSVNHWTAILNGTKPLRYRYIQGTPRAIYVQPHWNRTIETIRRKIQHHKWFVQSWEAREGSDWENEQAYVKKMPYHTITLQVENVVDVTPLGSK